jgi:cell division protein ZapA
MMPDLKVLIGGRSFNITCNAGEEGAAQDSAKLLDQEAELLQGQLGRLPEDKMLLLSGLLLGDKIRAIKHEQVALEETLRVTQTKLNELFSQSDQTLGEGSESFLKDDGRNSIGGSKETALLEMQNISDMLDELIRKINTYSSENISENNNLRSDDSTQESFL